MSTSDPRAAAGRLLGLGRGGAGRIEVWSWASFALLGLGVVGIGYLGARTGGRGPVWLWLDGRFLLVAVSFAWLLVGLGWSALHRPFLQRRRGRAFVALILVIGFLPLPMPYPSSMELSPSSLHFQLPLEGEWVVHLSGTGGGPLSSFTADRRYGLHLARAEDLALIDLPEQATECAGHGGAVLAPVAGRVAWVRDDLPDASMGAGARGDQPELGNVIVLEVAEGQFLFLGHLLAGSCGVVVGEEVVAGQALARLGFSGRFRFTPVPHLSLHLQNSAEEGWGEPIPLTFRGYVQDGVAVPRAVPRQGATVRRGE